MSLQHILVASSTYPSTATEKVPRFVEDQVEAMLSVRQDLQISVLAPHNQTSHTMSFPKQHHSRLSEYRFHYFFPRYERLTDRGIMPALSQHRWYYLLLPFFILGELIALYRLTRRVKPDVIYAHWFTPQAVNARLVSMVTKTPYVITTHASDVSVWKRFGPLGTAIVRRVSKHARAITAVSTQTKDKLTYFLKDPLPIERIPMGIPTLKQKKPVAYNQSMLFIGRLTEKKGLHYLIPALQQVFKHYPEASLTIAGDGELRAELENLVTSTKTGKRITFVGYVNGEQKAELFKTHAYMLVPSIITASGDAEGLPVSLMEGLAAGMLCVATDVSGATDLIEHNKNGFIVPSKDKQALTDQLRTCLDMDKTARLQVQKQAQATSRELEWPAIAKRHLHLFDERVKND